MELEIDLIRRLRVEPFRVAAAPVDLDEIEAPLRELEKVLIVVPLAARAGRRRTSGRVVVAASIFAGVRVDPGLETEPVDVGRDGLHTSRPVRRRVDGDVAGAVARSLPPALVDVDVLITGVLEAARHHGVRLPLDDGVVDLGGEAVPGRPPHRRPRAVVAARRAAGAASATGRAAAARCAAPTAGSSAPAGLAGGAAAPARACKSRLPRRRRLLSRRFRMIQPRLRRAPEAPAAPPPVPGPVPPVAGPPPEDVPPDPLEFAPPEPPADDPPVEPTTPPLPPSPGVDEPPLPPAPVPEESPPPQPRPPANQDRDDSANSDD